MQIVETIRMFLAASAEKQQLKAAWVALTPGDDDYYQARDAFRNADNRCETVFEKTFAAVKEAREVEELADALDSLSGEERLRLNELFVERGLPDALAESTNAFASLIRRVRRLGAAHTAAREMNARRRSLDTFDFEESLNLPPAAVDSTVWNAQVSTFNQRVDTLIDEQCGIEQDDVYREVAFAVEDECRHAYDAAAELLTSQLRDLIENGRFEAAVQELTPEDRNFARGFCTHVPQLQKRTAPERHTRPVMLAEPDTETNGTN